MVDFLPSSVDPAEDDRDPRVVGVDSDDADDLMAALSSDTSRDILAELYDEPASPASLADRVDTSLQNVQYHLGKLEDGDLVEVVDTVYSSKGREMDVYGPTAEPLVLFAGNEEETVGLKSALTNLLGGVGALGLASLVVQRLSTGDLLAFGASSNAADDGGPASGDAAAGTTALDATDNVSSTSSVTDATTRTTDAVKTATETTAQATQTAEATQTADTATSATETTETATTTARRVVTETSTTATETATQTTDLLSTTATAGGTETTAGLPPGLLFFAGGMLVLTLGFAVWYVRKRGQV